MTRVILATHKFEGKNPKKKRAGLPALGGMRIQMSDDILYSGKHMCTVV